jgi:hypothetical protein
MAENIHASPQYALKTTGLAKTKALYKTKGGKNAADIKFFIKILTIFPAETR